MQVCSLLPVLQYTKIIPLRPVQKTARPNIDLEVFNTCKPMTPTLGTSAVPLTYTETFPSDLNDARPVTAHQWCCSASHELHKRQNPPLTREIRIPSTYMHRISTCRVSANTTSVMKAFFKDTWWWCFTNAWFLVALVEIVGRALSCKKTKCLPNACFSDVTSLLTCIGEIQFVYSILGLAIEKWPQRLCWKFLKAVASLPSASQTEILDIAFVTSKNSHGAVEKHPSTWP